MILLLATHITLKFTIITFGVAMVRFQDQDVNWNLHAAIEYNKHIHTVQAAIRFAYAWIQFWVAYLPSLASVLSAWQIFHSTN